MRLREAAVLGVVQGVAEVVPVSSSAQLALVPWLLGWAPATDRTALMTALHAGSCVGLAFAPLGAEPSWSRVAASAVPAGVAGVLAGDVVERRLGRPAQLAPLLALGGLGLLLADRRARSGPLAGAPGRPARLDDRDVAVAALAQVAALVPGVSRSGATVTALLARGVPAAPALDASLRMSLPVTAGAAVWTGWRSRDALTALAGPLAVGVPLAAVSAHLAARVVRRHPRTAVRGAAVYRLGLAAVVAGRLLRRGSA